MAAWWVDRVLPGLVTSLIWVPVWTLVLWRVHRAWGQHQDKIDEIKRRLDTK